MDWSLPFGLTLRVQASWTGRQYEYDGDGNRRRIPDFCLLDVGLTFPLPSPDLGAGIAPRPSLRAMVTNLLDKDYEEGQPMPGCEFLVGARLSF